MPAKALLRCLCELSVKLNWCLSVPDNISNGKDDQIVKDKIRRWEKDTLCNNIEALEKFRNAVDEATNQKIKQEIEKLKLEPLFNNEKIKRLPRFRDITDQLPDIFRNEVYPLLYLQFNNAIHLDVTSLVDTYKVKNQKEPKADLRILFEYCVTHALHINTVIRMNYGIDVSAVRQEFNNIIRYLDETNAHTNLQK